MKKRKKISTQIIPNLKKHRTFTTARELQYYHIYKDAFKYHFKSIDEWIDYTYPEINNKFIREDTRQLIDKLNEVNRDVNSCEVCGINKNIEVHHIIPLWKGGTNDTYNLISLCSNHHTEAHKKYYHEVILKNKVIKSQRVDYLIGMFSKNT